MDRFFSYLKVAAASTIKFFGGPILGKIENLSWWETAISSTFGLMFTVIIVIYAGEYLQRFIHYVRKYLGKDDRPKKIFTRTTRTGIKVKNKLGLWGIAFLTPLIFTPIVGSFLSLAFRFPKFQIIIKMFICGLFWGAIQAEVVILFGDLFPIIQSFYHKVADYIYNALF